MREAIPTLPHMSLRCGAQLSMEYFFMAWYLVKRGDKFTWNSVGPT